MEIVKKLTKVGNSYCIIVPKALVEWGVLNENDKVKIKLEKLKNLDQDRRATPPSLKGYPNFLQSLINTYGQVSGPELLPI